MDRFAEATATSCGSMGARMGASIMLKFCAFYENTIEMPCFTSRSCRLLLQTSWHDGGAACLFRDITNEIDAQNQMDAKTATPAALAFLQRKSRSIGGGGKVQQSRRGVCELRRPCVAGLVQARLGDIAILS